MKLIRFGNSKSEKPGILTDDGNRFDVSNFLSDYDENFYESDGIKRLKEWFLKNKNSYITSKHKIRCDENEKILRIY